MTEQQSPIMRPMTAHRTMLVLTLLVLLSMGAFARLLIDIAPARARCR